MPAEAAIAGAAFAMGMQQAATEQLDPQTSISTTYMSGTVERVGSGLFKLFAGKPAQFVVNTVFLLAFLIAAFAVGKIPGTSVLTFAPCVLVAVAALLNSLDRSGHSLRRHRPGLQSATKNSRPAIGPPTCCSRARV
jgi:uncharacterized membrane protein YoaK (UPF0700 family)